MRASARHIAAAATAALLAGGCVSPHQSAATDVDPFRWELGAEILLPNADTVTLRDAEVFLRCNDRFAEDTLTLRIATVPPDSLRFEEPFRLVIPRGESRPTPLMREIVVPYRIRMRFAQQGDYRCILTPTHPVRGVEAVGINLTKSE